MHSERCENRQPTTAATSSQAHQDKSLPSFLDSCDRCQAKVGAPWGGKSGWGCQSLLGELESAAAKEDRFLKGRQMTLRRVLGKKGTLRLTEGGAPREPQIPQPDSTKGKIVRSQRRSFWRATLSLFGIRTIVQQPPSDSTSAHELSSGNKAGSSKKRAGSRNLDGSGGGESSKTHKVRKCRASVDEQGSKRRIMWACPFLRMNPRTHRECSEFAMTKISHVVQHLKRKHLRQGERICPMCGLELATLPQFNEHVQSRTCGNQALEHMTSSQEKQIKTVSESRRRGFSDEKKWYACWEILFPGIPRPMPPRGPFLEHPLLEEHSRIWNEFGDVEDDPEVEAASPAGVDGAVRRSLINAIRNAIARRISEYVDADLEGGPSSILPTTQEPTPTTQPQPLAPGLIPHSHFRNRLESESSRVLPPQQQAVSDFAMLPLEPQLPFTQASLTSEANLTWHGAVGVDEGPMLRVGHIHEASFPFDQGQVQPWDLTESLALPGHASQSWTNPSFPGNGLHVQAQELGLDAHGDSLDYNWQDGAGFPFADDFQLVSLQASQSRESMVANTSDADEDFESTNMGDNDRMPEDELSQWLIRYEGSSNGAFERPDRY